MVTTGAGFGTFGGVFTPSILTILGVIMYLRLGWVVGNVGLAGTLVIVTLATSITFLTALSISAIATDRQVRAGGAYYMISRSLGVESGGAIGIPLYFAQAISVALYTVGFAESIVSVFPRLSLLWIGVATTVGLAGLALVSARLARDGVLPKPLRALGRGSGHDDSPRIGTAATLGVALAAVLLGDLNVIAPVLSMFFLTTYPGLNAAAAIEGALGSPSYRPSFRVHVILGDGEMPSHRAAYCRVIGRFHAARRTS